MKNYKDLKIKLLKDSEIKREYQKLEAKYQLITLLIEKRIEKGLSQDQLARKIKTKQSAISRFESGSCNPSLAFIENICQALDCRLNIGLRN